jgi:hypothetical protein
MRSIAIVVLAIAACDSAITPDPDEQLSAGPFSVFDESENAFGLPVPGLDEDT